MHSPPDHVKLKFIYNSKMFCFICSAETPVGFRSESYTIKDRMLQINAHVSHQYLSSINESTEWFVYKKSHTVQKRNTKNITDQVFILRGSSGKKLTLCSHFTVMSIQTCMTLFQVRVISFIHESGWRTCLSSSKKTYHQDLVGLEQHEKD